MAVFFIIIIGSFDLVLFIYFDFGLTKRFIQQTNDEMNWTWLNNQCHVNYD